MQTHIYLNYCWLHVKVIRSMSRSCKNTVIHQECNKPFKVKRTLIAHVSIVLFLLQYSRIDKQIHCKGFCTPPPSIGCETSGQMFRYLSRVHCAIYQLSQQECWSHIFNIHVHLLCNLSFAYFATFSIIFTKEYSNPPAAHGVCIRYKLYSGTGCGHLLHILN